MGKTRKCHPNCLCAGQLWTVYRRTHSDAARNAVVEFYLPILRSIAKRQARILHRELDDVLSDGAIGLMSAVTKFKHGGAPFQSYAKLLIIGAIVDGVRALDGDCRYFSETRPRIIDVDIDHLTKPPQSDAAEYLDDLVAQLCPVDQTLVYYLRQGMTQAEIGRQLGVKQAAISIRIKVLIRKVRGLIEYSSFTD